MQYQPRNDWLARARDKIRAAGPPTLPVTGDAIDDVRSRRVLDLATRIGERTLASGASANDVTVSILRVTDAYGLRPVSVDVTYTSINVSYHRGDDHEPLTMLRVVRKRVTDFTALQSLLELIDAISKGESLDSARERYATITHTPRPYRDLIVTLANGLLTIGVCMLMGAGLLIGAIAFVAAALVSVVQRLLGRWAVPSFFSQAAGGLVVTATAMGVTALAANDVWRFAEMRPSIIVSAGIVLMLSGMSVVGSAQDAIDGFYLTAAGRVFEVMILTMGIIAGILLGLSIGQRAGYAVLVTSAQQPFGTVAQQLIGVAIIATMYGIGNYAGFRTVLGCLAMGVVGWGAYLLALHVGLGQATASGFGALVGSFLSMLVARRLRLPALALTTACIVPLVPGSLVFRGLLEVVEAEGAATGMITGAATLVGAAGVGLALAAGTSLGAFMGRPVRDTLTRAVRLRRR
ncbi:threonine/serine exporter family protein [Epidermidibacterium keratini]|nr:threonine/serine exporter family protein [Epidermidibacterium keratini]